MKYIDKLVKKIKGSEKGQGMVEYALIIAFVAAIAIVALNNGLGTAISNAFGSAQEAVTSAAGVAADTAQKGASTGGTTQTT